MGKPYVLIVFKFKQQNQSFDLKQLFEDEEGTLTSFEEGKIGDFLMEVLIEEIREDREQYGQLPDTGRFLDSFDYSIEDGVIQVTSDWPWIDRYVEGRDAYPMTWLTQQRGAFLVPIHRPDGTVVIRTAPFSIGDAWIHPAIARHTFIQRALNRTAQFVVNEFAEKIADQYRDT